MSTPTTWKRTRQARSMISEAAANRSRYRFSQTRWSVGSFSSAKILTGMTHTALGGSGVGGNAGWPAAVSPSDSGTGRACRRRRGRNRCRWPGVRGGGSAFPLEDHGQTVGGRRRNHLPPRQSLLGSSAIGLDEGKRHLPPGAVGEHDDAPAGGPTTRCRQDSEHNDRNPPGGHDFDPRWRGCCAAVSFLIAHDAVYCNILADAVIPPAVAAGRRVAVRKRSPSPPNRQARDRFNSSDPRKSRGSGGSFAIVPRTGEA